MQTGLILGIISRYTLHIVFACTTTSEVLHWFEKANLGLDTSLHPFEVLR